jgi:hypothetical protein
MKSYFQQIATGSGLAITIESSTRARSGFAGTEIYDVHLRYKDQQFKTDGGLCGYAPSDSLTLPPLWLEGEARLPTGDRDEAEIIASLQQLASQVKRPVRVISATPLEPAPTSAATHDVTLALDGFHITSEARVSANEEPDRLLLPSLFLLGNGEIKFSDSISYHKETSPDQPFVTIKCDPSFAEELIQSYKGTCGARLKDFIASHSGSIHTAVFVAPGYNVERAAALLLDAAVPNRAREIQKLVERGVLTFATGDGLSVDEHYASRTLPLAELADDRMCYWIYNSPFCIITAPHTSGSRCDDRNCADHDATPPTTNSTTAPPATDAAAEGQPDAPTRPVQIIITVGESSQTIDLKPDDLTNVATLCFEAPTDDLLARWTDDAIQYYLAGEGTPNNAAAAWPANVKDTTITITVGTTTRSIGVTALQAHTLATEGDPAAESGEFTDGFLAHWAKTQVVYELRVAPEEIGDEGLLAHDPDARYVTWQKKPWRVIKQTYPAGGRTAIVLYRTVEDYVTASVNLPEEPLDEGETFIRNTEENEGILEVLIAGGIVRYTARTRQTGYIRVFICKVLI